MTIRSISRAALALGIALALTGCARSGASTSAAAAPTALSLRALSSLTNYRATLTSGPGAGRMTIRTQVHSPGNWATESGVTTLHIGTETYIQFGKRWSTHAERTGIYAQTNLPSFARQFYGMTRVSGTVVRRGGPCHQAGLAGYTWTISAASGSSFGETFTACVADGSGALLKLVVGASGDARGGRYANEVYAITAVGNVPAFRPPMVPSRR